MARSGRLSIFAALAECCPACIRSDASASNRSGLTVIEMNKTLEKEGFHKMRDRRSDATTREIDPTGGIRVTIRCRLSEPFDRELGHACSKHMQ